ncbi:MAG: asparaginase [Planctomycetes bacterium]|nr:asparaginase [Planctomycetota bacterium]
MSRASTHAPSPAANPVLAETTRSGRVESWHRGALAVWHGGELAIAVGDVARPVFARSATKPFQALPLLERGLHQQLGLSAGEIAVLCASHDGAPVHTAAVASLLRRGGLTEDQLGCGPHAPFDTATRRELAQRGERPGRRHNNCSGKHAGFLLLAQACGDDLLHYLDPGCRSQREVAAAVAAMAGLAEPLPVGVDGCGAPTFVLPLAALARAFANLANPVGLADVRANACRTILAASAAEPVLVAGAERFCTALLRCWPGAAFAKNGAEGVYALGLAPDPARREFPQGLGLAVKIDDGAERAYWPVVVDALQRLLAFGSAGVPAALQPFASVPLHNTQKLRIGEVRSVLPWPR